jgi:2-phospho-L-lactate/phosphoenolpyruvate guanylyltransferase
MPTPLIPVKSLAEAKGRLAPALNPIQRRLLVIAMLEDVLDAVLATGGLAAPVVVSPEEEVWERTSALGCVVVPEPPRAAEDDDAAALNAALRLAAGKVAGDTLLVVAADVPLADAAALAQVRDRLAESPVVVVPSTDGQGTNVLGWRDPDTFEPAFGPGSAERHLRNHGAVSVADRRLALDVDTFTDLRAVAERLDRSSVTAKRLADLGLEDLRPVTSRSPEAG